MRRILNILTLLGSVALLLACAMPLHGQVKRPAVATTLSILVPGTGHLYAGETGKGLALVAVSTGAAVGGYVLATRCETRVETFPGGGTSSSQDCGPHLAPALIGGGLYLATWLYAVIDAGSAATRANHRAGLTVAPGPDGTRIGFRLALGR